MSKPFTFECTTPCQEGSCDKADCKCRELDGTMAEALPPHPQYVIDTMKVISEAVAAAEHETYGEALSNLQCDHVGINSSGELELATHKRMPLTITATPPTEEQRQNREAPTITINGEQVPATITKDPTA
jgi:hypothetical protein